MKRIEHREDKYPFCFVEYVSENASENLPHVCEYAYNKELAEWLLDKKRK